MIELLEIDGCEEDMERGDYSCWVERYPNEDQQIFGHLIVYDALTPEAVRFFASRGVDLNGSSTHYRGDCGVSTPLISACEYRCLQSMAALLQAGADPNVKLEYEYDKGAYITPLEAFLVGHSLYSRFDNPVKIIRGLDLLLNAGACREIASRDIVSDTLDHYKSIPVLQEVIATLHSKSKS